MSDQPAAQQAPAAASQAQAVPAPLEPPVTERPDPHSPAPCRRRLRDRRRRRWPRPCPRPRCPGSTPRSTLPRLAPQGRDEAHRSGRPRLRTCAAWGPTRSASRPSRPTGCSRCRSRRSTRGRCPRGSKVGKTLLDLRRTVEDLDPSQAAGAKKFLGMIPFGDRITDYFRKYQSAQCHLNGILHSLQSGQDELARTTSRSTSRRRTSGSRWAGSTSTSTSPSGSTPSWPPRSRPSRRPTPRRPRRCARTSSSTSGRSTRTC